MLVTLLRRSLPTVQRIANFHLPISLNTMPCKFYKMDPRQKTLEKDKIKIWPNEQQLPNVKLVLANSTFNPQYVCHCF